MLDDEIKKQRAKQAVARAWSECPVSKTDAEVQPATPETTEAANRLPRHLWNKRPGLVEGWFKKKDHLWPRNFGVAIDPEGVLRIREIHTRRDRGLQRVDSFCFSEANDSEYAAILLKDGHYTGSPSEIVTCVATAIAGGQ